MSLVKCEGGKPVSSINLIRGDIEDEAGGGELIGDRKTQEQMLLFRDKALPQHSQMMNHR